MNRVYRDKVRLFMKACENAIGKKGFPEIMQELEHLWKVEDLATAVIKGIPTDDDNDYQYNALSLKKKLALHQEKTREFIKLVGEK